MRLLLAGLILLATAACAAGDMGIQSMLVGDKMLELTDNRQLTLRADGRVHQTFVSPDGKYVVYAILRQGKAELRLARTSTGKTLTLMDEAGYWPPEIESVHEPPASGEEWLGDLPMAWSPDSSLFAFGAKRRTWDKGQQSEQDFIVIYTAAGAVRKALPVIDTSPNIRPGWVFTPRYALLFTPDSRKLVTNLHILDRAISEQTPPVDPTIELIDVATGASQAVYASKKRARLEIVGWSSDGSLLCAAQGELHKIALDGNSDETIVRNCGFVEMMSPDGMLVAGGLPSLTVKNQMTGKQIELAKDIRSFNAWAPNSRMLLYSKNESITDTASKNRKRDYQSLWLSSVVAGDLNHMCIALDAEDKPSCSRDCRSIAYVSQGQLYIAELTLRDPTVNEKLAVGLPLTEEETKWTMMVNAKQIGMAIIMYARDYDDRLPSADSTSDALGAYLRDKSVFCRPGTQENVFRYVDPGVKTLGVISYPADTILGELDAGYSWKAAVYADGHVKVLPKQ